MGTAIRLEALSLPHLLRACLSHLSSEKRFTVSVRVMVNMNSVPVTSTQDTMMPVVGDDFRGLEME